MQVVRATTCYYYMLLDFKRTTNLHKELAFVYLRRLPTYDSENTPSLNDRLCDGVAVQSPQARCQARREVVPALVPPKEQTLGKTLAKSGVQPTA